jgi:hypothetical protein
MPTFRADGEEWFWEYLRVAEALADLAAELEAE